MNNPELEEMIAHIDTIDELRNAAVIRQSKLVQEIKRLEAENEELRKKILDSAKP